jgi:hypothetical protein
MGCVVASGMTLAKLDFQNQRFLIEILFDKLQLNLNHKSEKMLTCRLKEIAFRL